LVYRPTGANQYPPFFKGGHNVKTGTQDLFIQNFNDLFVCLKPHKQFFSYLPAVTITGDRAANFGLCSGAQGL
jgi:hypothetical protein